MSYRNSAANTIACVKRFVGVRAPKEDTYQVYIYRFPFGRYAYQSWGCVDFYPFQGEVGLSFFSSNFTLRHPTSEVTPPKGGNLVEYAQFFFFFACRLWVGIQGSSVMTSLDLVSTPATQ